MSRIAILTLGVLAFFACSNPTEEIEMVLVEGGDFVIGSEIEEAEADEKPAVEVHVESFYISKFEVTQALWEYVMGNNPSYFQNSEFPVESVSYDDVQIFLRKLNKLTGKRYRLPTEKEWEYAAKGGQSRYCFIYSGNDNIDAVAWYRENSGEQTHPVGKLRSNSLGLYDMTGNVHEWCVDSYDGTNYIGDTVSVATDLVYVFKGGSFYSDCQHCRISNRNNASFDTRNFSLGFRLAHDAD